MKIKLTFLLLLIITISCNKIVPTKTSYKNKARIEEILELNRGIEYHEESKLNGNCWDYSFRFINEKYKGKNH